MAYDTGDLSLHAPIKLRVGVLAGDPEKHAALKATLGRLITDEPVDGAKLFVTTLGRALLSGAFPEDFPYINAAVFKSDIGMLIEELIDHYDKPDVARTLDAIKELGFRLRHQGGSHHRPRGRQDPAREGARSSPNTRHRPTRSQSQYHKGIITDDERRQELIEIWTEATDEVKDAMEANLKAEKFNPLDMMVGSGARGNMHAGPADRRDAWPGGQPQVATSSRGRSCPTSVRGSSVLEYFISTHGARKGLADTALRTADSGYLTRRLVDVSQEIIIQQDDCETDPGSAVDGARRAPADRMRNLRNRVFGRVLADDIKVDTGTAETASGVKLRAGDADRQGGVPGVVEATPRSPR